MIYHPSCALNSHYQDAKAFFFHGLQDTPIKKNQVRFLGTQVILDPLGLVLMVLFGIQTILTIFLFNFLKSHV